LKMPVELCQVDDYEVVGTEDLGQDWFRLDIEAPAIASTARAGQFVQVRIGPGDIPLIRRPFSIFDVGPQPGADATMIRLLVQRVGAGTRAMVQLRPGDRIDLMGPLGHPMPRPELDAAGTLFLVGGGIGVAPLYFYCRELMNESCAHRYKVLLGARSRALLIGLEAFESIGVETCAATDDGSSGFHGNIIQLLGELLDQLPEGDAVAGIGCGPHGMNLALRKLAVERDLRFWISLENYMPCGFGACFGCVIPGPPDEPPRYRRVCVEGPCFPAHELPEQF